MNVYKIFNKNIKSDITLSNIPISKNPGNDDYRLKSVKSSPIDKSYRVYHQIEFSDRPWVSFLKNNENFALNFHDFADFTIGKDKNTIYSYINPNTSPNTFAHIFADHVIPNILTLSQNIIFHASTIKIGEKAVSFLAPSGTGKSTLAAYFGLRKQELISDDSILIREDNGKYTAVPSYPGIRLWPSSVDLLFDEKPDHSEVAQYNDKMVIKCDSGLIKSQDQPCVLSAIYLLNSADETSLENISQSEAFSYLIKNLYRFDFEDRKNNENEFRFLAEMLNSLKLYKLNYSHNKGSLEKAYSLVTSSCLN